MLRWISRWLEQRRAERARRLTITDSQWQDVETTLPFLDYLSPTDRLRLRELARQLIVDKQWSSAEGLELTARIQLSIALQACLPILNLGLRAYAGWIGIVVYPGDFVIPRSVTDDIGIVHEFDDTVIGEAWEGGPVLLSWFEADNPPSHASGRINVVIHEFAHKLDMAHGWADGVPRLHSDQSRSEWLAVMQAAFDDLNRRLDEGTESGIDPYAAEAPEEFFATLSETFFTAPRRLVEQYPEVYQQLARYYRQDPVAQLQ